MCMLFKRSKELHIVDAASLRTTLNEAFWWEFKELLSNKLQPEDVSFLYELGSQSGSSTLELPHSLNATVQVTLSTGGKTPARFRTPHLFTSQMTTFSNYFIAALSTTSWKRDSVSISLSLWPFIPFVSADPHPRISPMPIHACILNIDFIFLQAKDHNQEFLFN